MRWQRIDDAIATPPSASARRSCRTAVLLAPMSGVTDAPFRRLVARLGAGLVVSEMVASDALVEGRRDARAARRRPGHRHPRRPACRLRGALDGRGRAHRRRRGRRHHRHQHGLPGQEGDRRLFRLGADARSRSCADADRGDGRRGHGAGHAEDAARLGRRLASTRRSLRAAPRRPASR